MNLRRMESLGQGIIAFIIALLLAIILISIAHDEPLPPLQRSIYDGDLNTLDREALDAAYRQVVSNKFTVWMRDDVDQPRRMLVGLRDVRRAYITLRAGIDERK